MQKLKSFVNDNKSELLFIVIGLILIIVFSILISKEPEVVKLKNDMDEKCASSQTRSDECKEATNEYEYSKNKGSRNELNIFMIFVGILFLLSAAYSVKNKKYIKQ